jgi:hypothetical protein
VHRSHVRLLRSHSRTLPSASNPRALTVPDPISDLRCSGQKGPRKHPILALHSAIYSCSSLLTTPLWLLIAAASSPRPLHLSASPYRPHGEPASHMPYRWILSHPLPLRPPSLSCNFRVPSASQIPLAANPSAPPHPARKLTSTLAQHDARHSPDTRCPDRFSPPLSCYAMLCHPQRTTQAHRASS